MKRHEVSCDVMIRGEFVFAVPVLIAVILVPPIRVAGVPCLLSTPVSFRLPRHRPPGSGTLIRASCAPAPAPVGARFAPARLARLIARARPHARGSRMAHVSPWPNRGLFRAGADARGSSLRMAPPPASCSPGVPDLSSDSKEIFQILFSPAPRRKEKALSPKSYRIHTSPRIAAGAGPSGPRLTRAPRNPRRGSLDPGSPLARRGDKGAARRRGVTRGATSDLPVAAPAPSIVTPASEPGSSTAGPARPWRAGPRIPLARRPG